MKHKNKMNKKGQIIVVNAILWAIAVIIGAVITPIMQGTINDYLNSDIGQNMTVGGRTVMYMIVPMYWLAIIVSLFIFVIPSPGQQRY